MTTDIEIKTLNKTERIETVMIRKGPRYYYFKGEKCQIILRWMVTRNDNLKRLINSL